MTSNKDENDIKLPSSIQQQQQTHSHDACLPPPASSSSSSSQSHITSSCIASSSSLSFLSSRSPSFRFVLLFLAIIMPFGGHVVKYSLSALAGWLQDDPLLHLTHSQLGTLQSAVSAPNLIVPLLGGVYLDIRGSKGGTIAALSLCVFGHAFFIFALYNSYFWLSVLGRVIFGLGQGSTVVAQGMIAARWFMGRELTLAMALIELGHNCSNWLAMVYCVPVAQAAGWPAAMALGVVICAISLIAGLLFFHLNPNASPGGFTHSAECSREEEEQRAVAEAEAQNHDLSHGLAQGHEEEEQRAVAEAEAQTHDLSHGLAQGHDTHTQERDGATEKKATDASSSSSLHSHAADLIQHVHSGPHYLAVLSSSEPPAVVNEPTSAREHVQNGLSVGFVILCLLHLVFSNCFHLFSFVSPNLLRQRYSFSLSSSAWLASLPTFLAIFLCPLAGWCIDRFGYKIVVCCACGAITTASYLLLLYSAVPPALALVMLSVSVACVPTILRSAVPIYVAPPYFGTAYGIYSVCESFGAVVGNALVGIFRDETLGWDVDLLIFAGMATTATALSMSLLCVQGNMNQAPKDAAKQLDRMQERNMRQVLIDRRHRREQQQSERDSLVTESINNNASSIASSSSKETDRLLPNSQAAPSYSESALQYK